MPLLLQKPQTIPRKSLGERRKERLVTPLPLTKKTVVESYTVHLLVLDSRVEEFDFAGQNALLKLKVKELGHKLDMPYFGIRHLSPKSIQAYMGRLRKLLKFLLFCQPHFDESLLMFYNRCPRNLTPVQALAIRYFLLAAYTPPGQVVFDPNSDKPMLLPDGKTPLTALVPNDTNMERSRNHQRIYCCHQPCSF